MFRLVISFLLAVLVLGIFFTQPTSGQQVGIDKNARECKDDAMKKINKLISEMDLVPASTKRHFPETLDKLKEACKANGKIINLVGVLVNKCLTGFKKNLMQVTLYSMRSAQKTLCKKRPTSEMKALVAAGKCVNSGRPKFRHCIRSASQNIYAMKFMPEKLRIPLVCCEVHRAKDCLLEEAKGVKECSVENVETLQTRFSAATSNLMGFACGDYTEESDRCNSVHPPKGAKLPLSNRSIVSILFELLDYLPGEDFEKSPNGH